MVFSSLMERFATAAIYRIFPVLFNDWKRLTEPGDTTARGRRIYEYTP